jgi:hypothetical protein
MEKMLHADAEEFCAVHNFSHDLSQSYQSSQRQSWQFKKSSSYGSLSQTEKHVAHKILPHPTRHLNSLKW